MESKFTESVFFPLLVAGIIAAVSLAVLANVNFSNIVDNENEIKSLKNKLEQSTKDFNALKIIVAKEHSDNPAITKLVPKREFLFKQNDGTIAKTFCNEQGDCVVSRTLFSDEKPTGEYRLYKIPRETNCIGSKLSYELTSKVKAFIENELAAKLNDDQLLELSLIFNEKACVE